MEKCSIYVAANAYFDRMTAYQFSENGSGVNCSFPEMYSVESALSAGFAPAVPLPTHWSKTTNQKFKQLPDAYLGFRLSEDDWLAWNSFYD